ncbi:MAG: Rho termination factor N-terminal domain-containing protein [Deltaproteobacteria bacterium]|nr:Rho termination factor N-terminal domain-containing protein [Deltaproteobacteria bacterium]
MSEEKPLEKYTVKQLKEMASEMEGIEGVSAMKKDELIAAIKKVKAIPVKDKPLKEKKADRPETVASIKEKIRLLKEKREENRKQGDKIAASRLKKRINRLKKKTRKMASV